MAESYVQVTGTVKPKGGTAVSLNTTVACDTVAVTEWELAHGDTDTELLISPAALAAVQFVYVAASEYPETVPGTPDLTYKIHDIAETAVPLSTFHLYMPTQDLAAGAAGLDFDKLFVSNAHAATDVILTIIVGYNVEAP